MSAMTPEQVAKLAMDEIASIRAEFNSRLDKISQSIAAIGRNHGERLDDHDQKLASLETSMRDVRQMTHKIQADLFRCTDALTLQGLTLERVGRNTDKTLELLQPKVTL